MDEDERSLVESFPRMKCPGCGREIVPSLGAIELSFSKLPAVVWSCPEEIANPDRDLCWRRAEPLRRRKEEG